MQTIDLAEKAARAVNPTAQSLGGFNIEAELTRALRKALKPIESRLRAYVASKATIQAKIERWSHEAFERKLEAVVQAAGAGDLSAAAELEAGNGPSRETFQRLCGVAWAEMEQHTRDHQKLFDEAARLVAAPMHGVVAKGQAILDSTLSGLGVPIFTLQGATNGVDYLVSNLERAGRGETADLQPLWDRAEV